MTHKRGRKANEYQTSWGEKIDGLCLRQSKTRRPRFYPTGKSQPCFGVDEKKAVHKFRLWQAEQEPDNDYHSPVVDQSILGIMAFDEAREYYRHLILIDPKRAALELDVPHLAFYPVTPDKPQFTLAELGIAALDAKRNKKTGAKLVEKYRKTSLGLWNEFCEHVDVTYVRDLTSEHIKTYRAKVMAKFDQGLKAPYVTSRFIQVKSILRWGIKETEDKIACREALDLCANFESLQSEVNPSPIDPAHFAKLLNHADTSTKAILLLGLNCAMHNGEVGKTLKVDIDLDKRTLVARRSKTRAPRVAWLWKRTVDAIRKYQKENPHHSPFLIVSGRGRGVTSGTIQQRIVTLRRKAKLPETVTFEGLRDAAYGAAEEIDSVRAKFLTGHPADGQSDKYVLRQADGDRIKACCNAIENHFFPPKKSRGKK